MQLVIYSQQALRFTRSGSVGWLAGWLVGGATERDGVDSV